MVETRRGRQQPQTRRGGRQPQSPPQGTKKESSAVTSPSPRSRKAITGDKNDDNDDDKIATRRHQPARQHAPLPPLPPTNAKRSSLPSTTHSRKKSTLSSNTTSVVNPPIGNDNNVGDDDEEDNVKQSSLLPSTTHSRNQVSKTSNTTSVVNPPIGKDNNEGDKDNECDKDNEAGDNDEGGRNQNNKDTEAGNNEEEGVRNQNDSDNESGDGETDIENDIRQVTGSLCVDGFRFVPSFDPSSEISRPLTIPFKNIGSFSNTWDDLRDHQNQPLIIGEVELPSGDNHVPFVGEELSPPPREVKAAMSVILRLVLGHGTDQELPRDELMRSIALSSISAQISKANSTSKPNKKFVEDFLDMLSYNLTFNEFFHGKTLKRTVEAT